MSTTAIPTAGINAAEIDATGVDATAMSADAAADTTNGAATNGATAAGAPGAPASTDRRGFSIASFVLGLVSIACGWTFFAPLTGLILGILALRAGTSERTLTIWGIALNGAMLALFVLGAIAVIVFAAFGLFMLPFAA